MSSDTACASPGTLTADANVHVSRQDQLNINRFARVNARLTDAEDEVKEKNALMQTLEDAVLETMMLEEQALPYLVADAFFYMSDSEVNNKLEAAKTALKQELDQLHSSCSEYKQEIAVLKRELYSKFGDNINLEASEDD